MRNFPLAFIPALLCLSAQAQSDGNHILMNKPVLDFEWKTLDGTIFKLSDHIGQPIIIDFWSVSCAPCLMEMPGFERLKEEYPELLVVSVTVDRKEKIDAFITTEENQHTFIKTAIKGTKISPPILIEAWDVAELFIDKSHANWNAYEMGWPQKFFIDKKGIIRNYSLGYQSNKRITPTTFNEDIYAFIKEKAKAILD